MALQRVELTAPFQPFIHRWRKVVELLDPAATEDVAARSHLQLLHETLLEELGEVIKAKHDMVENGVIDFEHLYTIFEPGRLIFSTENGKDRLFQLIATAKVSDPCSGTQYQNISRRYADMDGAKFGTANKVIVIHDFQGTVKIDTLVAFPVEFHAYKEALMQGLVRRGKAFEDLFGHHFRAYKGIASGYTQAGYGMVKYDLEDWIQSHFGH